MNRGVTLLELLVVLAIVGLLAGVGAQQALGAYRLRAAVAGVRTLAQQARTEALRRQTTVALLQQDGALQVCPAGDCQNQRLAQLSPADYGASVRLHGLSGQTGPRYNALGVVINGGWRIEVQVGNRVRSLCQSVAGRIREVSGASC